jgi:hypothetical protein
MDSHSHSFDQMLTVFRRRSTSTEGIGLADTVTGKNQSATVKKDLMRTKHTTKQQNDCVKMELHLLVRLEVESLVKEGRKLSLY